MEAVETERSHRIEWIKLGAGAAGSMLTDDATLERASRERIEGRIRDD